MFGLFKPKMAPQEPVEFIGDVEIDCPAEEVYALIDWADPRNAKRNTGNEIIQDETDPNLFHMTMPAMDEFDFRFHVSEAAAPSKYAFTCTISPQCGRMAMSEEIYEFEATGDQSCNVSLVNRVTFIEGTTMDDLAEEVAMLSASVQSALQKLKLQAEHGADVAKSLEMNTVL
ncbi:MAG: SRPBCC family protein [Erythrobacter sp.]